MLKKFKTVSILPYLLVVTLVVSLFYFPQLSANYFQTAMPVETSEEAPNNMPLVENLEDHKAVCNAAPEHHLVFSIKEVNYPLHLNLTPFLLVSELIKPPSMVSLS